MHETLAFIETLRYDIDIRRDLYIKTLNICRFIQTFTTTMIAIKLPFAKLNNKNST